MREQNVIVSENGRIIIPIIFRKELGIKPGDELMLSLSENNDIIVHSPRQSLHRLQEFATSKRKKSLVDATIEMRRKEKI